MKQINSIMRGVFLENIYIPVEISKDFTKFYESVATQLLQETIERIRENYMYKTYMNKKEACAYIGVSFNTFKKLEKLGLPIIEVDGIMLVKKEDIDAFLEKYK